jgi:lipase chaperone LimK
MRALDYTLEFFATDRRGEPERLERLRLRAVSAESAERQARAYVRNILVNNRQIDRCQIKNQAGLTVKEIYRSALVGKEDADRGDENEISIADRQAGRARSRPASNSGG